MEDVAEYLSTDRIESAMSDETEELPEAKQGGLVVLSGETFQWKHKNCLN